MNSETNEGLNPHQETPPQTQPQKISPLANLSFGLGLFVISNFVIVDWFFDPLLHYEGVRFILKLVMPIIVLVTGIIALIKIRISKNTLKGKKRAITGVIMGALSILYFIINTIIV